MPYTINRVDWEDGSISYEIMDERPDTTYRRVCAIYEDSEDRGQAKRDAELIVCALNLAFALNRAFEAEESSTHGDEIVPTQRSRK
jgi:hypothetical protein